jgi:GT2 family glycosyltransferase
MLIKREVFEKIGLFDENFFFYGEDLDFCLRAANSGFKILYFPKASAYHNIREIEGSRTSKFVMFNLGKSFFMIIRKHFSFVYLVYGIFLFIFIYSPFRFYQILKGKNRLSNILSWLRGGYSGLTIKLK